MTIPGECTTDDVRRWLEAEFPGARLESFDGPGGEAGEVIAMPPLDPQLQSGEAMQLLADALRRGAAELTDDPQAAFDRAMASRPPCGISEDDYAREVLGATRGSDGQWLAPAPPVHAAFSREKLAEFCEKQLTDQRNFVGFDIISLDTAPDRPGARFWFGTLDNTGETRKMLAGSDPKSPIDPVRPHSPPATVEDSRIDRHFLDSLGVDIVGRVGQKGVKIYSQHHRRCTVFADVSRTTLADWAMAIGPMATHLIADLLPEDDETPRRTVRDVNVMVGLAAGYEPDVSGEVGEGIWFGRNENGVEDGSVLLVASGTAAEWQNGKLTPVHTPRHRGHRIDFKNSGAPWFFFDRLEFWLQECEKLEFRRRALSDAIDLFAKWRWHDENAPELITALVLSTWLQSIWHWRPQVAIIGKSGSGKSYLFTTLEAIFGGLIWRPEPGSTVASIRRAIANTSRVVLLDEFDAEEKHQAAENQRILKMIRSAGRGGMITRCVGDGIDVTTIRQMFWLAGINVQSDREADLNRLMAFELLPPERGAEPIQLPTPSRLGEIGHKLLALAIWGGNRALDVSATLRNHRIDRAGHRLIESLSVPAAIMGVTGSDSEEFATQLLETFVASYMVQFADDDDDDDGLYDEDAGDEQALLGAIMGSILTGDKSKASRTVESLVIDLMQRPVDWGASASLLETYGIFAVDDAYGKALGLHIPQVKRHVLRNSPWQHSNLRQVLVRLPGASYRRIRTANRRLRLLTIPMGLIYDDSAE